MSGAKYGQEIIEQFEQIILLRQIPQIESQTNEPYHSIYGLLQAQINLKKNDIVTILQEFEDFNGVDQDPANKKGIQDLFKRLNEAL